MKVVFLAPTVVIVQQQFELITNSLPYKTGIYHDGVSLSLWSKESWENDFKENDVFVMVPEIFEQTISKSYFDLNKIGLIVFDECHHCFKEHSVLNFFLIIYLDDL
jgi:endoribonuclease Dicer